MRISTSKGGRPAGFAGDGMDEIGGEALQDTYPDDYAHCYGCGRLNPYGHHLKSSWEAGELVARFQPLPYHIAVPGFVYGGLLASLMDCHGIGTAAAAALRTAGQPDAQTPRFVTASLQVDYVRPTPLGPELELRATVAEASERKAVVEVRVYAEGMLTARGKVVAVRIPPAMQRLHS